MPVAARTAPSSIRGVAPTLDELLGLQIAARSLDLSRQNLPARNSLGTFRSRFRGRGMEFAELRAYQQGDDIRDIDWRVTARLQRPHTRVYQEERGRPLFIVVDLGSSMRFGSHRTLKSALAAETAALLAWAGLQHGDHVGGLIGGPQHHVEIPGRRGRRSLLHLLGELANQTERLARDEQPHPARPFAALSQQTSQLVRPGSLLILISDFNAYPVHEDSALRQLAAHNEILALRISDVLERELPPPGRYSCGNGQARIRIDSARESARLRFAQSRAADMEQQARAFARLRISLIDLDTAATALSALGPRFAKAGKAPAHA